MFLVPRLSSLRSPARGCGNPQLPSKLPSLVPRRPPGDLKGAAAASLFAGIRRSSRWSLLEDSGETSFSNRNEPFRFEEEEPGESCRYSAKSRIPAIHPCDDAVPFGAFLSPLSLCGTKNDAHLMLHAAAAEEQTDGDFHSDTSCLAPSLRELSAKLTEGVLKLWIVIVKW